MHCPSLIFSAMCNYESLNLFIPQTVRALLLWVVIVGGGEGADVSVTTLPECGQHHIRFLHKRMNLLK